MPAKVISDSTDNRSETGHSKDLSKVNKDNRVETGQSADLSSVIRRKAGQRPDSCLTSREQEKKARKCLVFFGVEKCVLLF